MNKAPCVIPNCPDNRGLIKIFTRYLKSHVVGGLVVGLVTREKRELAPCEHEDRSYYAKDFDHS